jgi:1,4-alpha-glucan branching enzyme
MIVKEYVDRDGQQIARVTFSVDSSLRASCLHLVGDFNDWDSSVNPFQERDGDWVITKEFPTGRAYQFRYRCDGDRWMNDNHADAYVLNQHGGDNCVLITDPTFKRYVD